MTSSPAGMTPSVPSPRAFSTEVNNYLRHCERAYESYLRSGGDDGVLASISCADVARRAHAAYAAIHALFIAPGALARIRRLPDPTRDAAADYLPGLAQRMYDALRAKNGNALEKLVNVAEEALENVSHADGGAFALVPVIAPPQNTLPQNRNVTESDSADGPDYASRLGSLENTEAERDLDDVDGMPTYEDRERVAHATTSAGASTKYPWLSAILPARCFANHPRNSQAYDPFADIMSDENAKKPQHRGCCGIKWSNLDGKQRLTLAIYIAMVLLSSVAAGYITYQFVRGVTDPEAVLRITAEKSLAAPIVTFCMAKPGVPASRLQMFNYTDANQRNYVGADPYGPQTDRQSPQFRAVVDRFFDNPDGEDCEKVVGDYFPFPLRSLNDIVSGKKRTKCRICYQVGAKGDPVMVTSTNFSSSSYAAFYTDTYFLQCMYTKDGPEPSVALPFLQDSVFQNRAEMDSLGVLKSSADTPLSKLAKEDFRSITSEQVCNILFFAYFPKKLKRPDNTVDIRYVYDAGKKQWSPAGKGPYFVPPKEKKSFLPTESIEMFVGTNKTTKRGEVPRTSDLAVLGPNTQSYVRFRPLTVFGEDRYDLSSTSSNFITDTAGTLYGYWYLYSVYFGYPRLIRDEIIERNSYPVAQWLVDFFGYLSLFTGLSFFTLLLVPVLQAARRREKRRLKEEHPEAYIWQRYRKLTRWRPRHNDDAYDEVSAPSKGTKVRGIMLP